MSRLEIYGIMLLVMLAITAGAYFKGHSNGVKKERNVWELKQATATKADLQELKVVVTEGNNIAKGVSDSLQKQKPVRIIEKGVIEREIKTDVRYAADCFPDTGRLQWNSISAGRSLVPSSGSGFTIDSTLPKRVSP